MAKSGDVRDTHLGGRALFESWKQEFTESFFAEEAETMIRMALADQLESAPPEQLAILEQQNPEILEKMIQFIEGGTLK